MALVAPKGLLLKIAEELAAKGVHVRAIMRATGLNRAAIVGHFDELGIQPTKGTAGYAASAANLQRNDEMLKLQRSGQTLSQIAAKFGISKGAAQSGIAQAIKAEPPRAPAPPPPQWRKFAPMLPFSGLLGYMYSNDNQQPRFA